MPFICNIFSLLSEFNQYFIAYHSYISTSCHEITFKFDKGKVARGFTAQVSKKNTKI